MTRYNLLVLSNPSEGLDEEFNRWYTDQHLGDVLRIPGFRCAQRFQIRPETADESLRAWRYAAVYEFESDSPEEQLGELMKRAGGADMLLSPALDVNRTAIALLVPVTERVSL
jgi:hypothetical protein